MDASTAVQAPTVKLLINGQMVESKTTQWRNVVNPAVLGDWIAKQGVNRKQFESIYNAFAIQSKATQGGQLATSYNISGVPAFIIDGKYLTAMSMTQSEPRLFEVLDQLIVKARAERKTGKPAR